MNKRITRKTLMFLTIVGIVGLGAYAFADWGMANGTYGWGHHGPGMHHQEWGGPEYGCRTNDLSDEEIDALEKERESFREATEDLRQDVYAKRLELRGELAKKDPDAKKAAELQGEISKLQAEFDQKRIDHLIKVRKISPKTGKRFMGRGGRGYGPSAGGSCWR
jgi:Spy/CpxP family protein refolding chaperone